MKVIQPRAVIIIFVIGFVFGSLVSCGNGTLQVGIDTNEIGRKIFVVDNATDSVSVFDADANGDVSPERVLGSGHSIFIPGDVFVDEVNNELYVTSLDREFFGETIVDPKIVVYSRDAKDTDLPIRTISGSDTRLFEPIAVFVDTKNNEVFVANNTDFFNEVLVYDRLSNGNVKPKRVLNVSFLFINDIYVAGDELFVIDFFSIKVFNREAETVELEGGQPLREISYFDVTREGFFFDSTSIFVDEVNDEIYVTLFVSIEFDTPVPIVPVFRSRVVVYRRDDRDTFNQSGFLVVVQPQRIIEGPNTGLFQPDEIFVDTTNDEIYVSNFLNNTVTVYDRLDQRLFGLTGGETVDLMPIRILENENPESVELGPRSDTGTMGIYVDTTNEELFVANSNLDIVRVFNRMDKGVVKPLREIGSRTGIFFPSDMFVDTKNSEIYITNEFTDRVTVYDIGAEGNASPKRSFTLGRVGHTSITVDSVNNEIFITNFELNAVLVYERDSMGNVAPKRIIRGDNTGLFGPNTIFVDTINDEIFVTNSLEEKITIYDRNADGNSPPKRVIQGPDTELFFPAGIFVTTDPLKPEGGEIFVTNFGDFFFDPNTLSITVYDRTASGNAIPKRKITSSFLFGPFGIHVDTSVGEIFVTDQVAIFVFDINADGFVDPRRSIFGTNTGLINVFDVFVADLG